MNTILKTAIFATAPPHARRCATKALTPEEQAFQDAQRSCTEQTNSMIGGSAIHGAISSRGATISNGAWKGKGYTKDQLKSIWY